MVMCAKCGTDAAPYTCSRCDRVHYCSKKCQTAHWKGHKRACAVPGDVGTSSAKDGPCVSMDAIHDALAKQLSAGNKSVVMKSFKTRLGEEDKNLLARTWWLMLADMRREEAKAKSVDGAAVKGAAAKQEAKAKPGAHDMMSSGIYAGLEAVVKSEYDDKINRALDEILPPEYARGSRERKSALQSAMACNEVTDQGIKLSPGLVNNIREKMTNAVNDVLEELLPHAYAVQDPEYAGDIRSRIMASLF